MEKWTPHLHFHVNAVYAQSLLRIIISDNIVMLQSGSHFSVLILPNMAHHSGRQGPRGAFYAKVCELYAKPFPIQSGKCVPNLCCVQYKHLFKKAPSAKMANDPEAAWSKIVIQTRIKSCISLYRKFWIHLMISFLKYWLPILLTNQTWILIHWKKKWF